MKETSLVSRHINLGKNEWKFEKYSKKDCKIHELNKGWEQEFYKNQHRFEPYYEEKTDNVVLLQGFQHDIDLKIGAVSTTLDWNSLGTDGTSESESDTDLVAEDSGGSYARKQFSVDGTRKRTNQTATFKMVWDPDTDTSGSPITVKESGIHWGSTGSGKCHARVASTGFTAQTDDLIVIVITELHENGTL